MGAGYAMWTRVKQLVRGQVSMKLSVGRHTCEPQGSVGHGLSLEVG